MENIECIQYVLLIMGACCLVVDCYVDLREQLLPDWVAVLLSLTGLAYGWLIAGRDGVLAALSGGLLLFFLMLVLYWFSRGGMGLGDVKLALALGLWLGVQQGLLCLLLAFVLGGVVGVGMLCFGHGRGTAIAFGPYLCLGAVVALVYGEPMLRWYGGFF